MAVMLRSAAMPSDLQKGLHPFFENPSDEAAPDAYQTPQHSTPVAVQEGQSTNSEECSTDCSDLNVQTSGHDEMAKKVSSQTADSAPHPSRQRTIKSIFSTGGGVAVHDRSGSSTKRRKLSHSDGENSPITLKDPTPTPLVSVEGTTEGYQSTNNEQTEQVNASAPVDSAGDFNAQSIYNQAVSDHPKKLLRLNGAGGFGSPPSKQNAKSQQLQPQNQLKPRKDKAGTSNSKSLNVVIPYGAQDPKKRDDIGQKIEKILQGTHSDDRIKTEQPQPVAPSNGPKTTHPFFLGSSARKTLQSTTSVDVIQDRAANTSSNALEKPKAFSTSGKLWTGKIQQSNEDQERRNELLTLSSSSAYRLPGTFDAPWPWRDFTSLQPAGPSKLPSPLPPSAIYPVQKVKRKYKVPHIPPQENILSLYAAKLFDSSVPHPSILRDQELSKPARSVLSGPDIQAEVLKQLGLDPGRAEQLNHPKLIKTFNQIHDYLSAFDKGECESALWASKFAPQSTSEVLQPQQEMSVLRSWLQVQTVTATDHGSGATKRSSEEFQYPKRRRKKRKSELDDFIVDSDDDGELTPMQDFSDNESSTCTNSTTNPRSVVREAIHGKVKANAVLLSGPNGCGKTAAAIAAAKELGFEVFEIGPGSRRSGRDILDKVGDMTLNHQVSKAQNPPEPTSSPSDDAIPDTAGPDQSTLASFFTASKPKVNQIPESKKSKKLAQIPESRSKLASRHQQSLILLEEVDVLFEHDKQFWETVIELAINSKRPIIMTCSDENLIPFDQLSLYAVLRFRPPPKLTVARYLCLLAAAEGHILKLETTLNLYKARGYDLRASIHELQYWCQMAIGDRKGGIEWFLPRWPPGADLNQQKQRLRVASIDTLPANLILTEHSPLAKVNTAATQENLLYDAWREYEVVPWDVSLEDLPLCQAQAEASTPTTRHRSLRTLEIRLDWLSANDTSSIVDLPSTTAVLEKLDTTQPPISGSQRANYIDGYPLLQADPLRDYEQLDAQISLFTHLNISHQLQSELTVQDSGQFCTPSNFHHLLHDRISTTILKDSDHQSSHSVSFRTKATVQAELIAALEPLATQSTASPTFTSLDRNDATISTELAPYVRCIASFDLALERQRQALTSSQGSGTGNSKYRTTRASRSALEGSQRSETRRERWFTKDLNLALVLKTGGTDWPRATQGLDVI